MGFASQTGWTGTLEAAGLSHSTLTDPSAPRCDYLASPAPVVHRGRTSQEPGEATPATPDVAITRSRSLERGLSHMQTAPAS